MSTPSPLPSAQAQQPAPGAPEKELVPGPDGTMMSRSAAKKAFKLAETAARKANKAAIADKAPAAAGEGKKKEKTREKEEEEPEWINHTVPGEKKG